MSPGNLEADVLVMEEFKRLLETAALELQRSHEAPYTTKAALLVIPLTRYTGCSAAATSLSRFPYRPHWGGFSRAVPRHACFLQFSASRCGNWTAAGEIIGYSRSIKPAAEGSDYLVRAGADTVPPELPRRVTRESCGPCTAGFVRRSPR
jgi:hypothetical protein